MPRKYTVIEDELKILGRNKSGFYAIMPYETLTRGKALFKLGLSSNIRQRFEQYHTAYPLGFYIHSLLIRPDNFRSEYKTQSQYFAEIEHDLFMHVINVGKGELIRSTTRVKHMNDQGEGQTEWIFAKSNSITEAFEWAQKEHGGELHLFNLDSINETYKQRLKNKPNYEAKIVIPLKKN